MAEAFRALLITIDYAPSIGGAQRLLTWLVDESGPAVEWRVLTLTDAPRDEDEAHVFRFRGLPALLRALPHHARWLRHAHRRAVVAGHAFLAPAALTVRRLADVPATTLVYGSEVVPRNARQHAVLTALPRCDRVIAISRFTADVLRGRGVASGRIVVVEPILPSRHNARQVPRAVGGGGLVLVSIARLAEAHKNFELALRAVAALAPTGAVERYVVIGDGPRRPHLVETAAALGVAEHVRFAGALDDAAVLDVLDAADLGLVPSRMSFLDGRFEGYGLVAHELAAAGLPVLAGDAAGLSEACRSDWSLRLDPDDLAAWVDTIGDLAADGERRLAMRGAALEWTSAQRSATPEPFVIALATT